VNNQMQKEPYLKPEIKSEVLEPGTLLAKPSGNGGCGGCPGCPGGWK
jgi:hypothetical protein